MAPVRRQNYTEIAEEVVDQYLFNEKQRKAAMMQIKADPNFHGRAYHVAHHICGVMNTFITKREKENDRQRKLIVEDESNRRDDSGEIEVRRDIFRPV